MSYFARLHLLPEVQNALEALNFKKPTAIQQKAIPIALKGVDLIGTAQTGTGKTVAFCAPILNGLLQDSKKNALILVPTRELALQIEKFWIDFTSALPLFKAVALVGGVPMEGQIKKLQNKPRLVIATPGRLVDLMQRENIRLSIFNTLVLDEADRMLDMGFQAQILEIVGCLPKAKQTLFFSATWSTDVDQLAKALLRTQYERVTVGEVSQAAESVSQTVFMTTELAKPDLLLEEINSKKGTVLVFTLTQAKTDEIADYLESYGVPVNRLHGGRSQGNRSTALKQFREGKIKVLVATDIAARGIDVNQVGHVINFDLPQIAEDYVHRIGRTGRAGALGSATTFLTSEDTKSWNEIVALLKKTDSVIPKVERAKTTRPPNAEDLITKEPSDEEQKSSKKPTRSHPGSRRENQWHKGSVKIKPIHEQRIKPKS